MPVRPCRCRLAVFVLLFALAPAGRAAAEWRRIDSPGFVVVGDVGERQLREVANRFEGFRETLSRVLVAQATSSAVPTVVIVFPSSRAFTPFKPIYNGKPIDAAGLFVSGSDVNYIAVVHDGATTPRIVFHEYAHLVIANLARNVPVWLSEGLAEYYSTYESTKGGQEALLGRPIGEHLEYLSSVQMLPLDDLLKVEHGSPLYNEGERRSLFYAQSWALTHMLFRGTPSRTAQLGAYLDGVGRGQAPDQAWAAAFGQDRIEKALHAYVRQRLFQAQQWKFDRKLSTMDAPVRALAPADAEAFLADFLAQQDRTEHAAARLAALGPSASPLVSMVLGRLEMAGGDHAAAEARLTALQDVTDWLVAYRAGVALADIVDAGGAPATSVQADAGRRFFAAARAGRPELPHALARSTTLELPQTSAPSAETLAAIERARTLAPGRIDYIFMHGRILTLRQEFAAARRVIGPLMSSLYPAAVRDSARSLMGWTVTVEQAHAAAAGRSAAAAGSPAAPEAAPTAGADGAARPEGAASRTAADPGSPEGAGRLIWSYRAVEPGEVRVEGVLERIDCSDAGVVFQLRTAQGALQMRTPRLDGIDFISYRDDLTGSVACGALTRPLAVYVTTRSAAGVVAAVEFLPDPRP